jgi:hypothetical protein
MLMKKVVSMPVLVGCFPMSMQMLMNEIHL